LSSRISGINPSTNAPKGKKRGGRDRDDVLRDNRKAERLEKEQHNKFSDLLKTEEFKAWLRSKNIGPGIVDMSNLPNDPWLLEKGLLPPGHKDAPSNTGSVFWKLISNVLETPEQKIVTLSLANNNFNHLVPLQKLPNALPYIRALDLSGNPIHKADELKHLLSPGEAKGKASSGAGSLKHLVELKLEDVKFRTELLSQPDGDQKYQHEVLRRFPGLLVLDGVNLNRIIFPLERKPIVKRTEDDRKPLRARPFTYPFDIRPSFEENEAVHGVVMAFCQKFYTLFDANRSELFYAYRDDATISISPNTLPSRSWQAAEVNATRNQRPAPVSFEAWTSLPGRNFFRSCTTIEQRTATLKSPMDKDELNRWWTQRVPRTEHPLTDASKWCIDAWYFDDNQERISAVIQGQFKELPSGTWRSFTRTFILGAPAPDSPAVAHNWPCVILSDMMVVHSYLGTGSWDGKASLGKGDVGIVPPGPPAIAPAGAANEEAQKAALIAAVRQRTGMNANFSELCLSQNGWDVDRAVANFEEIRATIPPDAFN
jgi:nuclear RNA export factor